MTGKSSSKDPTKPALTLVSEDIYHLNRQSETTSERIRRLQVEAKILAREQVEGLEKAMASLAAQARDISLGGDAYPPGIRDMASRLADDLETKAASMDAVMERISLPTL
jgi:hypothetical protein